MTEPGPAPSEFSLFQLLPNALTILAICAGLPPPLTNARRRSRSARASASPIIGYSAIVMMLALPPCR